MNAADDLNPSSLKIGDYVVIRGDVCKITKITITAGTDNITNYKISGNRVSDLKQIKITHKIDDKIRLAPLISETHVLSNIIKDSHCRCGCFAGYYCSFNVNDKIITIKLMSETLGDEIYFAFNQGKTVNLNINKRLNTYEIVGADI